jgi:PAS domain S-box-containing protein
VGHLQVAFPSLAAEDAARPLATAAPALPGELDLATILKVSQALSAELVIDALIERLMVIAVEHAGAARGVLILAHDGELRVEARANAVEDGVRVGLGSSPILAAELPESLLRFVARTGEAVILGDAIAGSRFAGDPYVAAARARSILCLPLVKQGRLVGIVYLENSLAPQVFTPRRTALLELLASQAAISLENARLHADVNSARDQLRRAERASRLAIDAVPALAWSTRADGSIELLNEQWMAYTGQTLAEADHNWGWRAAIHPEDVDRLVKAWTASLASGAPLDIEARMRRHDGVYRWFLLRGRPVRDEQGRITRWYGTNIDIEDLKRAESALRRNEEFLNDGERMSKTGSFSWDLNTGELHWSLETCRIYEVDPSVTPRLEMVVERTHPADVQQTRDLYERAVRAPDDWEIERRLLFPDGRMKHVHVLARLVRDEAGNPHYYAGAVKDITQAKREEARLQSALEEKEALLKEVHHRVKNNLQLISSLLSLQEPRGGDGRVAELFAESRNRVRSMALVHENLYRAGHFGHVPMAGHIADLCHQLARAYAHQGQAVELVVSSDDLHLDMDRAICCGLIINELVSNAFKHAFTASRRGTVTVHLAGGEQGLHVLTVSDDGVGLPPELVLDAVQSTGLQLVQDLVAQLHGALAVSREPRTTFTITFGPDERARRDRAVSS